MNAHSPPSASSPVRLVSRRVALRNSKWSVNLDHIEDDRGLSVTDYISLSPRLTARADRLTGVTVVPLTADGIVLLRTYRHALEAFFWEAARGFIDPDEDPREAALRELTEETGLTCRLEDLRPLGFAAPESSTITGRCALFAAVGCTLDRAPVEDEIGLGAPRTFPPEAVRQMLETFTIEDATTEIALQRLFGQGYPGGEGAQEGRAT